MHNSRYKQESQDALAASHQQLAIANLDLEGAVADELDVREHAERQAQQSEEQAQRAQARPPPPIGWPSTTFAPLAHPTSARGLACHAL